MELDWFTAIENTGAGGLILVLMGVALVSLVGAAAFAGRDRIQERLDRVARRHSGAVPLDEDDESLARPPRSLGDAITGTLRASHRTLGSIAMANEAEQAKIRKRLLNAGFRDPETVTLFLTAKVLVALILLTLGGAVAFGLDVLPPILIVKVAVMLVAAYAGIVMPDFIIGSIGKSRQAAIARSLPDALDLLIICANAGYSLDLAITRVGREMRHAAPEMGEELLVTADELRVLTDRREALRNLASRNDLEPLRSLVSTLLQAQKYGTPLTQALRTLAAEMRNARMMAIEEKAARLPAIISIPLMILILPAVFIIVVGPAGIQVAHTWVQ